MAKEAFEYRLLCKQCGDKSVSFYIDKTESFKTRDELFSHLLYCIKTQLNVVALPAHKGHDFEFKEFRLHKIEDVDGTTD